LYILNVTPDVIISTFKFCSILMNNLRKGFLQNVFAEKETHLLLQIVPSALCNVRHSEQNVMAAFSIMVYCQEMVCEITEVLVKRELNWFKYNFASEESHYSDESVES
jgi:hypothetical protein